MGITKAERAELRGVVRTQFRVLRDEVDQRGQELSAEIEAKIYDRFHAFDEARAALMSELEEMVDAANKTLRDLLRERGEVCGGIEEYAPFRPPQIRWQNERRIEMRHALHEQLRADMEAAKLRLKREEADLLKSLAVDALESEAARAFLTNIPAVGELVSAARLSELEQQIWGDEHNGGQRPELPPSIT